MFLARIVLEFIPEFYFGSQKSFFRLCRPPTLFHSCQFSSYVKICQFDHLCKM